MAGFGARGRGGRKKLFNDRIPPAGKDGSTSKETAQARLRAEKLQAHINYQPRDRYPKISYPVSPAPTLRETAIMDQWKADQKKIRDGPLFVRRVVDAGARVKKNVTFGSQMGNTAFNVIPTYTTKYERKYRQRPTMTGKLWLKPFLPKELWDIVDPSLRKPTAPSKSQPDKETTTIRFNLNDFSDGEDDVNGNDKQDDSDAEPDPDAEPEELDEDWEDDEDEADDYNGEKYFDDGERDDVVGDDVEFGDDFGGGGDDVHEREFNPEDEFNV